MKNYEVDMYVDGEKIITFEVKADNETEAYEIAREELINNVVAKAKEVAKKPEEE